MKKKRLSKWSINLTVESPDPQLKAQSYSAEHVANVTPLERNLMGWVQTIATQATSRTAFFSLCMHECVSIWGVGGLETIVRGGGIEPHDFNQEMSSV